MPSHQILSNRINSQRNKAWILNLVRMYPGITRSKLAELLNLSRTAITNLVNDLISQNLMIEAGESKSERGRRPVNLLIASRQYYFLAIEISAEHIRVAVIDLNSEILSYSVEKFSKINPFLKNLEIIDLAAQKTLKQAGIHWDQIHAIGCGISAYVDPLKGVIVYSENIPGWENVALADVLKTRYKKPCYVDTNYNLLALSEKYYGKGRGISNFIYLNVEVGISAGIFTNGNLYRGSNGAAGEIGHIQVEPYGPICNCGKAGCLERLASSTNIISTTSDALKRGTKSILQHPFQNDPSRITPQTVTQAAEQGDLLAAGILDKAGVSIAQVLVGMVHSLNPELIVLGGPIFKDNNYLKEQIIRSMKGQCLPYISQGLRIESSSLDFDQSFFIGALVLISEKHWAPENPETNSHELAEEYKMKNL